MEIKDTLTALETMSQSLKGVVNVLIFIARFLFLTPWGWILIAVAFISMVIVKMKNGKDGYSFSSVLGGVTESLLWFYSNITNILIGIFLVLVVSMVYVSFDKVAGSLRLFKEVKTLEATLNNLNSERKVLELTATPVQADGKDQINVNMKFFAYSPVREKDVESGEYVYTVEGSRLYMDFGVINFKYAMIENGDRINIAFPYRAFSDTVASEEGESLLLTKDEMPLSFKLPSDEIYNLDEKDYRDSVRTLIATATNEQLARKMGIRSSFSQAFAVIPQKSKVYTFYSTGAGGMVLK